MLKRTDEGVWMHDAERWVSVARVIAVDAMRALDLDVNDFRTRDKIIAAISTRVNASLDEAAEGDIYRRAMESMAVQMIHPKMTALEIAKCQLDED